MNIAVFKSQDLIGILYPAPNCGLSFDEIVAKDVPAGATDLTIMDSADVPGDRLFYSAWQLESTQVVEDLALAKSQSHVYRRQARDKEFEPWDRKVTVPSEATAAEAQRQVIRDKYAQIQVDIDAASNTQELRTIISGFQGS